MGISDTTRRKLSRGIGSTNSADEIIDAIDLMVPTTLMTDTTLTAADTDNTYIIGAADVKVTLPATEAGVNFTFFVKTVSATTGFQLSPVSVDKIMVSGLTAVDDKDLINSAATDSIGDSCILVADGTDGYYGIVTGTWAMEA